MTTSQEWLNKTYPNKEEVKVIGNEPEMNGNLTIVDFPNLKKIILQGAYYPIISKCEIKNCPKLKEITIVNCQMKEFITDDLPNLTSLDLYCNSLTSLDISKYPKLTSVGYALNDNLIPPLQTLTQKIQAKERELFALQIKEEFQTKITNLEKEIQDLLSLKVRLEAEIDKQNKTIAELQEEIITHKRKIDELGANYQTLLQELDKLTEKAKISGFRPENQTVTEKIKFFNAWLDKSQKEKEELRKSVEKEQRESQQIRTSLNSLQEELKNSQGNSDEELNRLNQRNTVLVGKIRQLEEKQKQDQIQIKKLTNENSQKQAEINNVTSSLQDSQEQLQKEKERAEFQKKCLIWGVIAVILLGIGWFGWQSWKKWRSYF